jgi:hypothetical protein
MRAHWFINYYSRLFWGTLFYCLFIVGGNPVPLFCQQEVTYKVIFLKGTVYKNGSHKLEIGNEINDKDKFDMLEPDATFSAYNPQKGKITYTKNGVKFEPTHGSAGATRGSETYYCYFNLIETKEIDKQTFRINPIDIISPQVNGGVKLSQDSTLKISGRRRLPYDFLIFHYALIDFCNSNCCNCKEDSIEHFFSTYQAQFYLKVKEAGNVKLPIPRSQNKLLLSKNLLHNHKLIQFYKTDKVSDIDFWIELEINKPMSAGELASCFGAAQEDSYNDMRPKPPISIPFQPILYGSLEMKARESIREEIKSQLRKIPNYFDKNWVLLSLMEYLKQEKNILVAQEDLYLFLKLNFTEELIARKML